MLKLHEIESIERHIQRTTNSGEKASETAFKVLKEFLVDRLLSCISSSDPRVRRAAVRVSTKFASLSIDHQKRVIFSMSNGV